MPKRMLTGLTICTWIISLVLGFSAERTSGQASGSEAQEGDTRAAVHNQEVPGGTIVAFGDSLTEGFHLVADQAYPARLEKKLRVNGYAFRVVNAGISGETSGEALGRVQQVLNLKPDIVILETGANDGFRGLNPDLVEENINEIVYLLKERGVVVILAGMRMVQRLRDEYITTFGEIYRSVAKKHNVILMPFFLEGVAGNPKLNFPDGIHPTAEGYGIVAENIYPYVLKAIERARAQSNR